MIDAIFYLNLDHRMDRRGSIEREIRKWLAHETSAPVAPRVNQVHSRHTWVERVSATKEGALGCTRGHAHMLRRIADGGYGTSLVLEDDFVWEVPIALARERIGEFLEAEKERYAICQIAHVPVSLIHKEPSHERHYTRVREARCTMGYLIDASAAEEAAALYEAHTASFEKDGAFWKHCADLVWRPIQEQGKCFAMVPRLGRSLIDYSDLQGRVTDYG